MTDDVLDLLRRALPHVQDEQLVREMQDALDQGGIDASQRRRFPPWLSGADGIQLMMIQDPQDLNLDGHDPAELLKEVRTRIDRALKSTRNRSAYVIERWLREEAARYDRRGVDKLDRTADRQKPGSESREFANQVARLFHAEGTRFADLLVRAIDQHRSDEDPDGRMALRRIADAVLAAGGSPGDLLLIRGPDGSGMAYVDMGGIDAGTIGYDIEDTRFVVATPADWSNGFTSKLAVRSS